MGGIESALSQSAIFCQHSSFAEAAMLLFAVIGFIFFIALHYNDLLLLTEVGGMQSVLFVWKKSQTPPFMGTEPDEENLG